MKVAILQHRLLHYRTKLFDRLRVRCQERGIELMLVHGQASNREAVKKDEGHLPWALTVRNRIVEIGERDILWQPLPSAARDVDLLIVMQESRIVSNYPILLSRLWRKRKVGYWGHGKNFQSDAPAGLREKWKRFLLTRIDWWFAYTAMTVDILKNAEVPPDRITQLDNAIDTDGFKLDLAAWSPEDLTASRQHLSIKDGAPVAVFCGSLYPDKLLGLMVAAADLIKEAHPDFKLLVIGDGPSAPEMHEAARSRPWIHMLGVQKGREKAKYFLMSDVMLNPGLVGLHIVDAFCAGLVIVTTAGARHSPEVAYLENHLNGVMTGDGVQSYAEGVLNLFADKAKLAKMKRRALEDSNRYTLDNMVERFAEGIQAALKA